MILLELFNSSVDDFTVTYDDHDRGFNTRGVVKNRQVRFWSTHSYTGDWICGFECTDDDGEWSEQVLHHQDDAFRVFAFVKKSLLLLIKKHDPEVIVFDSYIGHKDFYESMIKKIKIPGYTCQQVKTRRGYQATFEIRKDEAS